MRLYAREYESYRAKREKKRSGVVETPSSSLPHQSRSFLGDSVSGRLRLSNEEQLADVRCVEFGGAHVSRDMKRHNREIDDSEIRSSVNNQVLVHDTIIADGSDFGSTDGMISRRGEDDSATRRQ